VAMAFQPIQLFARNHIAEKAGEGQNRAVSSGNLGNVGYFLPIEPATCVVLCDRPGALQRAGRPEC